MCYMMMVVTNMDTTLVKVDLMPNKSHHLQMKLKDIMLILMLKEILLMLNILLVCKVLFQKIRNHQVVNQKSGPPLVNHNIKLHLFWNNLLIKIVVIMQMLLILSHTTLVIIRVLKTQMHQAMLKEVIHMSMQQETMIFHMLLALKQVFK